MVNFAIKNLENISRWKAPKGRVGLKLDLNENNGVFSDFILEKIKDFNAEDLSSYPEYDKTLEALASYNGVETPNLLITNGADQAIDVILRTLFKKGDKVILPSPVFSLYNHCLQLLECDIKHIAYTKTENAFAFPYDKAKELIEVGCEGLILCNPNNPLGVSISEEEIEQLIKLTNQRGVPCIIDEAYFEFYGMTSANLIEQYDNLVIIRTFSKVFGLAGLRFGYAIAQEYLIKTFLKVRGPWDVNSLAVFASKVVLDNKDFFDSSMKAFQERKNVLTALLQDCGFTIIKTHTNFVLASHSQAHKVAQELRDNKILVSNVSDYPESFGLLKETLRIAVPSEEELKTFSEIIVKITKNI